MYARSERLATIGYAPAIGAVPKGATPNPLSPTGYTIGPVYGNDSPWLIDVAEQMGSPGRPSQFGFPVIKMVYWKAGGINENGSNHIVAQIESTKRWVVVTKIHGTDSPFVGVYVVPIAFRSAVEAYGAGRLDSAVKTVRAAGEVLTHAGSEVAKTVVETAGEVYKTTVGFGTTMVKTLGILAVVAAVGLTLYAVNKTTGGAIFGSKKAA